MSVGVSKEYLENVISYINNAVTLVDTSRQTQILPFYTNQEIASDVKNRILSKSSVKHGDITAMSLPELIQYVEDRFIELEPSTPAELIIFVNKKFSKEEISTVEDSARRFKTNHNLIVVTVGDIRETKILLEVLRPGNLLVIPGRRFTPFIDDIEETIGAHFSGMNYLFTISFMCLYNVHFKAFMAQLIKHLQSSRLLKQVYSNYDTAFYILHC